MELNNASWKWQKWALFTTKKRVIHITVIQKRYQEQYNRKSRSLDVQSCTENLKFLLTLPLCYVIIRTNFLNYTREIIIITLRNFVQQCRTKLSVRKNNKQSRGASWLLTLLLAKKLSKCRIKPPKCSIRGPLKSQKMPKKEFTNGNH